LAAQSWQSCFDFLNGYCEQNNLLCFFLINTKLNLPYQPSGQFMKNKHTERLSELRTFYDSKYYSQVRPITSVSPHLRRLANKIGIKENQQVLDVACGTGNWLLACKELGAVTYGVDLSEKAIAACKEVMSVGEFHSTSAEELPFGNKIFDVVTCLGALEHFVDPHKALLEMVRVAKDDAKFLLLVPNADFLTRRLGLFSGTHQTDVKEEVRTLDEWQKLFEEAGFEVERRWPDLHVLSWSWISANGLSSIPLRAAQALALTIWPLKWQYQVYHLCRARKP
jgi:ubiquinone/menaquinone biosynthesis C-methylase UbiE